MELSRLVLKIADFSTPDRVASTREQIKCAIDRLNRLPEKEADALRAFCGIGGSTVTSMAKEGKVHPRTIERRAQVGLTRLREQLLRED